MTDKIIPLREDWREGVEVFIENLKNRTITHAVICYRKEDGDLCYQLFGAEHTTYLIGMMDRVKMELHKQ